MEIRMNGKHLLMIGSQRTGMDKAMHCKSSGAKLSFNPPMKPWELDPPIPMPLSVEELCGLSGYDVIYCPQCGSDSVYCQTMVTGSTMVNVNTLEHEPPEESDCSLGDARENTWGNGYECTLEEDEA